MIETLKMLFAEDVVDINFPVNQLRNIQFRDRIAGDELIDPIRKNIDDIRAPFRANTFRDFINEIFSKLAAIFSAIKNAPSAIYGMIQKYKKIELLRNPNFVHEGIDPSPRFKNLIKAVSICEKLKLIPDDEQKNPFAQEESLFSQMPPEIFNEMAKHLNAKDVQNIMATCKPAMELRVPKDVAENIKFNS